MVQNWEKSTSRLYTVTLLIICRVHHAKSWAEALAGIKITWRNIDNLRNDTILVAESKEELKSLLMKVKEESGKTWFKTQHSKN